MLKSYYISPMKINAMIEETTTGNSIKIGEYTYVELSRAPRGRRVTRRLAKEDGSELIKIYS